MGVLGCAMPSQSANKLAITSVSSSALVRQGQRAPAPLSFLAGRPPTVPPPPAFLTWFHPATLHLDLDERQGDLKIQTTQ